MTNGAAVHVPVARLALALGLPRPRGRIKARAQDFRVDEILGFELSGSGEHAWLRVEKRDLDTPEVARVIADAAGVRVSEVGFAGLKDRRAVTTQWFSVPARGAAGVEALDVPGVRVLESTRHGRKLRRGALRGNRFRITITDLSGLDRTSLENTAATLRERGVPNYFGEQRFGRDGSNLVTARGLLFEGRRVRDRELRGLALSAARSMLFNQVLDARVRDGTWDRILPGELVALDGSRSHFRASAADDALAGRLAAFDIHPSGPLPGKDAPAAEAIAGAVEDEALAPHAEWIEGLARAGLEHQRRALRVPVRKLEMGSGEESELVLDFVLPRGAYATMVVREVVELV